MKPAGKLAVTFVIVAVILCVHLSHQHAQLTDTFVNVVFQPLYRRWTSFIGERGVADIVSQSTSPKGFDTSSIRADVSKKQPTKTENIVAGVSKKPPKIVNDSAGDSDFDMTRYSHIMTERIQHLHEACTKYSTSKRLTKNIIHAADAKALYCAIPKIGSSFLLRVMKVLALATDVSPLDMSGLEIHTAVGKFRLNHRLSADNINVQFRDNTKIMFTRHPYLKIFSAFVDKLYVLSFEPVNHLIIRKTNIVSGNYKLTRLNALNASFAGALQYAMGDFGGFDMHFHPPSDLCDVCHINYDIIGKMETFNDDVEYFLTSINKSSVLKSMGDIDTNNSRRIVIEIVLRTFTRTLTRKHSHFDCESKDALLRRLWNYFQIRGYISDHIRYPLKTQEKSCDISRKEYTNLALDALSRSGSKAELRNQRHRYYLQAFRTVPLDILHRYRDFVRRDCELFGYDCTPAEIFQGRKQGDEESNIFSDLKYIYKL